MIDAGLLLPLNLDNLPNYQQLNLSFKQLTHLVKDGVHYGLPFAWAPKYSGHYSVARNGEINI
jgi:spermidine/putrescine-binding protein